MKNKAVQALVDKINEEKLIKFEGTEATVVEGAVDKLLPEGVTVEEVKKASEAKANAISALAIAFGQQSKAEFDKNKEAKEMTFAADIDGITTAKATIKREHTVKNNFAKEGEPDTVTRQGYLTLGREDKWPVSDKVVREKVSSYWNGLSS